MLAAAARAAAAANHAFRAVRLCMHRSYDRPCIERWLQHGNNSCPATGQMLAAPVQLVPNVALRNSIEEWAEKHAPWLLVGGGRRAGCKRRLVRQQLSRYWLGRCMLLGLKARMRNLGARA